MPHLIQVDENGNIVLRLNWKRTLKVSIILILALSGWFLPIPGLTLASRISLIIFIGAAGLWVTEAIPPFATAIMVIVLNIYLLGIPGGPLHLAKSGVSDSYQIFLNPIASPVLVLFFGGFILAIAATKHGLDVRLAKAFIKPFGTRPSMVLLGIISITALFSMFMSNTATTAMMIAILTPLLTHFEGRVSFKKAMVLAVPFAANIGGLGTIIGTPPNAVAASVLNGLGYHISFLKWMVIGVPVVIIMLLILWGVLLQLFKPRKEKFIILFPEPIEMTWDLVVVVFTFVATILLWLTEPLHHIPSAVVALLPIFIFFTLGILNRDDLKRLEWDVLILVAGGLTLGVSMVTSGLSEILVGQVSFLSLSPFMLLFVFVLMSVVISNFMSNTSASNLIIPLVTSVTVISPVTGAIGVAFACSLAMSLPISTPPNAIAFATNQIETREMVHYGTIVSLFGLIVIMATLFLIVRYFNLG
ncbi:MAG: DASS family sodium-coupled anion symporter [Deltaproteobacteria bacterium]|nr:DASS family sodium-coupled anion symporter [Deltaproteobacteria bacterium]